MKTDIRNHWHYGHDVVEGRYRGVGERYWGSEKHWERTEIRRVKI